MTPTPWYRNPVAVMGYVAQLFGLLMVLASVLVTVPGLPTWVPIACGVILALGSKLGLDYHSAQVRVAEIAGPAGQTLAALQGAIAPSTVGATKPYVPPVPMLQAPAPPAPAAAAPPAVGPPA